MAQPEEPAKDNKKASPPRDDVQLGYLVTTRPEEQEAQEGSRRRSSLTQSLKETGQQVVAIVGALFKDNRGEKVDPEDDPEFVRSQPPWEDDLKQYLPEIKDYQHPWNVATSLGASPSTSTGPIAQGFSNVASTSSRPAMVPAEGSAGNASMGLLLGIKKAPQSLAAHRWHKAYQFVKRQNALKKKAMSSPLGTGAKLHGHALGVVPVSDEIRQSIFSFWKMEYVLACLIVAHITILILKAENKWLTPYVPPMKHLHNADIALTTLYTMEILSRIFCLGFWQGPHAYLRNPYNKLDVVIIVDSWIHIARTCVLGKDAFCRVAVLRLFRVLLSLRHLTFVANVLAIMDTIVKTALQMKIIFAFTIIIMSFYSLVGVLFLGGRLQNRCIRITDNQTSYPPMNCVVNINDPYGYLCDPELDQYCLPYENPNWGISSFDNYAAGLLILFQLLTVEGWALQMQSMNDTSGYTNAYFMIFVIVGTYFLVNIYIAAISNIFLRVRHEHQALLKKYRNEKRFSFAAAIDMANLLRAAILQHDAKITWRQRLSLVFSAGQQKLTTTLSHQGTQLRRTFSKAIDWNDPKSYLKRLSSFGLSNIDGTYDLEGVAQSSRPPTFGRSLSRNLSIGGHHAARLGRTFSRNLSMGMVFAARTTTQKCAIIVNSKIFMYAVLTMISLNMAGLCTFRANMSHSHIVKLEVLEIGMLIIFAAEMVLRFLAAGGIEGFIDERMNIVDTLIVIISFGATGFGPNKRYPNLTPIRMLRWFYKKNSHLEELGEQTTIVVAILRSFGSLVSVFFFFGMVILVFAIIGMELWGGQFYNFPEGYPRANFDTIGQALLLWFSVTTAESWPNQMWNTMRPNIAYQWMGPPLFVFYYVLTAIFTLNLIMAVILEQTELTDNQKKFIQKRDHIKWLQTKHKHHVTSTRSSDWLVGAVEGAQKGYKGMKRRMSTMKVTRMSLFPVFQPETGLVRMMSSPPREAPPDEGILPKTTPQPISQTMGPPARRHSIGSSPVNIPGTIADAQVQDKSKGRIFRRSSISALNSVGIMPQPGSVPRMRHGSAHEINKVILRSGFGKLKPILEGEGRTVLQTALLNVVQDQKEVAKIVDRERKRAFDVEIDPMPSKPVDNRFAKPKFGKMPSRKEKGPRLSFTLSDYEGLEDKGEKATPWYLSETSLFIFKRNNLFRIFCIKLADHPWYLYFQYIWIWISMFVAVEETPWALYEIGVLGGPTFPRLDKAVLAVFCADFVLKVVAYGFLFAPESYLSDPFIIIDIFSLLVHLMKAGWPFHWQGAVIRGGPVYRTLILIAKTRPCRFIVRCPGLRTLVIYIFQTIPAITQVFIFTLVIYSIFAVIGMQLYANRFRSCTDPIVVGHLDCVGIFYNSVGVIAPRVWVNPPFHFDDFGDAMLSLFVLSTFDNWLDLFAYTSMDLGHHSDLNPQRNQSPSHIIYFVSFVCIGGFFILRMFVGVFIDQFGIISGSKLLTERQKLWRDTNRIIQHLHPTRLPKHFPRGIRRFCYKVVHSRRFELIIIFVILINYVYIASQPYSQATPNRVFDCVEAMFVSLYLLEALLKFLGTQFKDWWHHKWNFAELVLAVSSAACLFPRRPIDNYRRLVGGFFYILRIFRIIRYVPQLSNMASTMFINLSGMVDIVSLMGIVLFLFAGIGENLFLNLKNGSCSGFNMSFFTFTPSFALLFQVTTLDNWSCLIADVTVQPPFCQVGGAEGFSTTCGLPVGGLIYLIALVCVNSHILANLFVAQIIDCITFGLLDENAMLTPSHLYDYQHLWAQNEFDYHCTGYIGHHKLREFVNRLGPPLGRRSTFQDKWITRIEYEAFNFRSQQGIPFRSLLETLVLYKIGPRGLELPVRIERERQLQSLYRTGAAMKIQALGRGYLQRKGYYNNGVKQKFAVEEDDKV